MIDFFQSKNKNWSEKNQKIQGVFQDNSFATVFNFQSFDFAVKPL